MILSALALLPGLGSSGRLTYHEAFVAQGAREILDSGNWAYPTIGGLPWLEKPPLPWWLVAALGRCAGGVNETVARLPSAFAAIGAGPGCCDISCSPLWTWHWSLGRCYSGYHRLDCACAADWLRQTFSWHAWLPGRSLLLTDSFTDTAARFIGGQGDSAENWRLWRWAFLVLLGVTALVKGIGFGAVLILSVVGGTLLWQRDLAFTSPAASPGGMGIGGGNCAYHGRFAWWRGTVTELCLSGQCTCPTA